VLLLYEPFDRCDEATIRSFRRHIIELASTGVSILILTDNPEQVEEIATRIYRMKNGKLEEEQLQDIPTITPFKIPIKYNDRVILINPVDVLYIEAVSGASMLHTREESLDSVYTLNDLEARLGRSGFFRTHRSYLVNLQHVREVIPYTRNSFSLRLNDTENTEIPLSKAAASELRALLDY
jgi:ABC-2 type transport system ATP-binding protein